MSGGWLARAGLWVPTEEDLVIVRRGRMLHRIGQLRQAPEGALQPRVAREAATGRERVSPHAGGHAAGAAHALQRRHLGAESTMRTQPPCSCLLVPLKRVKPAGGAASEQGGACMLAESLTASQPLEERIQHRAQHR